MDAEKILSDNGYHDVKLLQDFPYETAILGVTTDNCAVYDYNLMIEWLITHDDFTCEEAADWIDYNIATTLSYTDEEHPVIMHSLIV